jgi:hypothetical protein
VSASGTQSEYRPARPDKRRRSRGVVLAIVAATVAAGLFLAAALLTSRGGTEVRLGDNEFNVGDVKALAKRIDRDGPLLFQDLLIGGTRDIYVNHVGSDERVGWVAFNARVPGSPRTCTLVWTAGQQVFTDPCTHATVPPDGGDLPHYPTRVTDDGTLIVDLTPGGLPGQGLSTPTTATTILVTRGSTTTTAG